MTNVLDEQEKLERDIIKRLTPALREQGAVGKIEIYEYDAKFITFIDANHALYNYKKGPENYGNGDNYYH